MIPTLTICYQQPRNHRAQLTWFLSLHELLSSQLKNKQKWIGRDLSWSHWVARIK